MERKIDEEESDLASLSDDGPFGKCYLSEEDNENEPLQRKMCYNCGMK